MKPSLSFEWLLFQIETEVMGEIARLLGKGARPSAQWQAERLMDTGILRKRTAEILGKQWTELERLAGGDLTRMAYKAGAAVDNALGGEIPGMFPAFESQVHAWRDTAIKELNLVNQGILEAAPNIYTQTVSKVSVKVLGGFQSLDQALIQTSREWVQSGLPVIIDKANRQWSAEGYGRMLLRTNIRRAVTETQMSKCREHGVEEVEISSHADARPLCAPYQGQIYKLSELKEKTSYGEAAGLFGINCTHEMYPFVPGVSTERYKTYDEEETKEAYEESQEHRSLERGIRGAKREIEVYEKMGKSGEVAAETAREKLKERQKKMREFVDKTGRKRQYSRERIFKE